ncbi:MAG: hypothetical protein AAGC74_11965 [Verrucomicrobiota bacterium]
MPTSQSAVLRSAHAMATLCRCSETGGTCCGREEVAAELGTFAELLRVPNELERLRLLIEWRERGELKGSFGDWVEDYFAMPLNSLYETEIKLVARFWAEDDAEAAAAWLSRRPERYFALNRVLRFWGGQDFEAAREWVSLQEDKRLRSRMLIAVIEGGCLVDFDAASELLQEMPKNVFRDKAARVMAGTLTEQREVAHWWVDSLEPEALRMVAAREYVRKLAQTSIDEALQWSGALKERLVRGEAREALARLKARENGSEAMKWVGGLEEEELQDAAKGVVFVLAQDDLERTYRWLSGFEERVLLEPAWFQFLRVAFEEDPSFALSTAMELQDVDVVSRQTVRYFQRWRKEEPSAAEAWLRSQGERFTEQMVSSMPFEEEL